MVQCKAIGGEGGESFHRNEQVTVLKRKHKLNPLKSEWVGRFSVELHGLRPEISPAAFTYA